VASGVRSVLVDPQVPVVPSPNLAVLVGQVGKVDLAAPVLAAPAAPAAPADVSEAADLEAAVFRVDETVNAPGEETVRRPLETRAGAVDSLMEI